MNYVALLMIFLTLKAIQISMNWHAVIKEKKKMLFLKWTFLFSKESGF
jgi:hypothetical protein